MDDTGDNLQDDADLTWWGVGVGDAHLADMTALRRNVIIVRLLHRPVSIFLFFFDGHMRDLSGLAGMKPGGQRAAAGARCQHLVPPPPPLVTPQPCVDWHLPAW